MAARSSRGHDPNLAASAREGQGGTLDPLHERDHPRRVISLEENPKLADVWVEMAEHFLDTETRHDIPRTALVCLEAGLSIAEAREVWRYEVPRAVGLNVRSVAGEWTGWDRDWLVSTVERLRHRWDNRPWTARALRYRLRAHAVDGVFRSIERHMAWLASTPREAREEEAHRMGTLARLAFDFDPPTLDASERARLLAMLPHFLHAIAPAFVTRDEAREATLRLGAALERGRLG